MERRFAGIVYTTQLVQDNDAGYIGLELRGVDAGSPSIKARLIYWDATGQFYIETFGEVPVEIVQELIKEAESTIEV